MENKTNSTTSAEIVPTQPSITERNIPLYFLLTLISCGLFGIYWFCTINDDTNTVSGHPEAPSGVIAFVLSIVTCGIYSLFWIYNMGTRIDEAKTKRGIPSSNSGVLFLILTIFGCGFIAQLLLQSELNKLAK